MSAFALWVVALAALLYWPVAHLIWIVSVRRLERRLAKKLGVKELAGQKRRARIIALFVVVVFSFLYNASTLGLPAGS